MAAASSWTAVYRGEHVVPAEASRSGSTDSHNGPRGRGSTSTTLARCVHVAPAPSPPPSIPLVHLQSPLPLCLPDDVVARLVYSRSRPFLLRFEHTVFRSFMRAFLRFSFREFSLALLLLMLSYTNVDMLALRDIIVTTRVCRAKKGIERERNREQERERERKREREKEERWFSYSSAATSRRLCTLSGSSTQYRRGHQDLFIETFRVGCLLIRPGKIHLHARIIVPPGGRYTERHAGAVEGAFGAREFDFFFARCIEFSKGKYHEY